MLQFKIEVVHDQCIPFSWESLNTYQWKRHGGQSLRHQRMLLKALPPLPHSQSTHKQDNEKITTEADKLCVCSSTEHQIPSVSCNTIKKMKMECHLEWRLLEKPWNMLIKLTYLPVVHLNLLRKIPWAWGLYKFLFSSKKTGPERFPQQPKFLQCDSPTGELSQLLPTPLTHL